MCTDLIGKNSSQRNPGKKFKQHVISMAQKATMLTISATHMDMQISLSLIARTPLTHTEIISCQTAGSTFEV